MMDMSGKAETVKDENGKRKRKNVFRKTRIGAVGAVERGPEKLKLEPHVIKAAARARRVFAAARARVDELAFDTVKNRVDAPVVGEHRLAPLVEEPQPAHHHQPRQKKNGGENVELDDGGEQHGKRCLRKRGDKERSTAPQST
jgi:hypothetical protein